MRRAVSLVLLLCVLASSLPANARADDREACLAALDDDEAERWARRVDADLRHAERRGRAWFWSWIAVNSAFVIGASLFARFAPDDKNRAAGIWGAAGSGATLALLLAPPLSTAFVSRRMHRLSEAERSDPHVRLARGLAWLERGASQERAQRAWPTHVLNGAFSLTEGLVLGLRYDHAVLTALSNGIGTFVIAEAQTLSAPRAAGRSLARLREDGLPCEEPVSPEPTSLRPAPPERVTIVPLATGVRVQF